MKLDFKKLQLEAIRKNIQIHLVIRRKLNYRKAKNNKEFIEKISYLINHPEERKIIARNGLNTAKKLDIKETAKSIYEIYKELL